jgi:[acyl-carrier-protein] S-malonyltransferase
MAGFLLLCPGQGAQHRDMLALALADPLAQAALQPLRAPGGGKLVDAVQGGQALFDPSQAQVALVATACATWLALAPRLPAPSLVAGYSLGELSAWGCAGGWPLEVCTELALGRSLAMSAATPPDCGMGGITGPHGQRREDVLAGLGLHLAIDVDADQVIVAGTNAALAAAQTRLQQAGGRWHALPVAVPSHSPLLAAAAATLRQQLKPILPTLPPPAFAVMRGTTATLCRSNSLASEALADAIDHPIRWRECLGFAREHGVVAALELPPGRALTRMLEQQHPGIDARAVEDFRSLDGVARWLARALGRSAH